MENIFIELLPPWVETGIQPAFYDKESGTVLQQTARMYAKVNQLTEAYNTFTTNLLNRQDEFETNLTDRQDEFESDINETVDDYIEQFNTLHDYVHDYFDNLDVQQEVNHKLDEMADNGTLASLISTQILGDLSTLHTDDKSSIVAAVNETYDSLGVEKMDEYRKDYYSRWQKVTLPNNITDPFFNNFAIYTNNGKNYYVDFDRDSFKNSGGTTYYVATTGDDNTGDGTENNPYKTIFGAYRYTSAGDTIILKNGIYNRTRLPSTPTTKIDHSINIIGESQDGVWLKEADDHTWEIDADYNNVYTTSRTGVHNVIDIRQRNKGIFFNLTQVNSKADCAATENSWYYASPNIYVNLGGDVVSDDSIVVGLGLGSSGTIFCNEFTGDSKLYFENINVLNGDRGIFNVNNNTLYDVTVYIKNCKFYNNDSYEYTLDSMSNRGAYTICENVVCNNTRKDGFNYHRSSTDKQAIGIEINCVSMNCGYGQTESGKLSNNSTTAHDACQVIRVNGVYGDCNGGVAVDVGTVNSAFYNCTIFDSYGRSYDLYASDTVTTYVYDCFFKGSKSDENLKATTTSYVYYNDGTEFNTKDGANVILIQ